MKQSEKSGAGISGEKAALEATGERKKKSKKGFVIFAFSGLVATLILLYGGVAIYYQSHFLPGTRINNVDCSNLDTASAAALLERQGQNYTLQVTGRNWKENGDENQENSEVLGTIEGTDIGLTLTNVKEGLQNILSGQNVLLWPTALWSERANQDLPAEYAFDEELLEELTADWEAFQEENMTAPKDAYISEYDGDGYEIIPGVRGTELDTAAALESIKDGILRGDEEVNLEEAGCYKTASVTEDDEKLEEACSTMNKWVQSQITYDWNGNEVILDGQQIQEWISVENGEPELNEEAVAEFVASSAREFDTYGKNRKFTTSMGVELTLPSGAFGWKTDREAETEELIQLIYQGSVLEKEPVYTVRGAAKGEDDIGSSYVEIDLSHQHLYLYQNGELKLESDFVSGDMSKPGRMTPPGVFGLTYKTRNAVLRGDDYETPVSYWMPFNGNVGMHDASWRGSFGGDIYLTNGSHGCINLPPAKAKEIYEYVHTGFPVICYYY